MVQLLNVAGFVNSNLSDVALYRVRFDDTKTVLWMCMGVSLKLPTESAWESTVPVKRPVLIFTDEGLVDLPTVGAAEYVLSSYAANGVGKCWKLRCLISKPHLIMDVRASTLGWIQSSY